MCGPTLQALFGSPLSCHLTPPVAADRTHLGEPGVAPHLELALQLVVGKAQREGVDHRARRQRGHRRRCLGQPTVQQRGNGWSDAAHRPAQAAAQGPTQAAGGAEGAAGARAAAAAKLVIALAL